MFWSLFGNQPPHPPTFGKDLPKKNFFFTPSLSYSFSFCFSDKNSLSITCFIKSSKSPSLLKSPVCKWDLLDGELVQRDRPCQLHLLLRRLHRLPLLPPHCWSHHCFRHRRLLLPCSCHHSSTGGTSFCIIIIIAASLLVKYIFFITTITIYPNLAQTTKMI